MGMSFTSGAINNENDTENPDSKEKIPYKYTLSAEFNRPIPDIKRNWLRRTTTVIISLFGLMVLPFWSFGYGVSESFKAGRDLFLEIFKFIKETW